MIQIKLKDGSAKSYEKGITILEVAKNISEGLARVALAGEVNGELKDLRTLNEDCQLNLLTFDDQGASIPTGIRHPISWLRLLENFSRC